jgi:hypothetical protein
MADELEFCLLGPLVLRSGEVVVPVRQAKQRLLPQARHHWQQALTRYAAIGAPEGGEIPARLAMAGDSGGDDDKLAEKNRMAPK